jgi:heptosyltransferase-2
MDKIEPVRLNILVIRLSSMGDVLLTTPLVRQLKNHFPELRLDFISANQFSEIYKYNPHLSNLWKYDKSWSSVEINDFKKFILKNLGNKKYDIVIDLQRNFRSRILRRGLGKKYYSVKKHRLNKLSLVYFKKSLYKNLLSIPDIYRQSIIDLKIEDDAKGLELWLPGEEKTGVYPPANRGDRTGIKKIVVAPGAHHFTKRWLTERFAEMIDLLKDNYGAEIILVGGTSDVTIIKEIMSKIKHEVQDFSGSASIIKTAEIINSCDLLITNDTGVMHIAAARQVPIVAIFGSSVKDFGFSPFRVNNIIVEKDVPCRPCSHIGRASCPKGHFDCMKKITVEDVLKAVDSLFKN